MRLGKDRVDLQQSEKEDKGQALDQISARDFKGLRAIKLYCNSDTPERTYEEEMKVFSEGILRSLMWHSDIDQ